MRSPIPRKSTSLKIHTIVNSWPLIERLSAIEIEAATTLQIMSHWEHVIKLYQSYQRLRLKLFDRYGEITDEESGTREILPENKEAFTKSYAKLMEADVPWPFEPLDISVFEGKAKLSIQEALLLQWFIK